MAGGKDEAAATCVIGLDSVMPVALVVAAVLMTLEPTIGGVSISDRQIVLAFFGFLGTDALAERTGRLRRIERRVDALAGSAARRRQPLTCYGRAAHLTVWT